MQDRDHWENIYRVKPAESVSWYQIHAEQSLRLIRESGIGRDAAIIDVGGGASTLVDDLLAAGWENLSVLDLSTSALQVARARLGARAATVRWIEADVIRAELPRHGHDLWHDRAVFHFLTTREEREAYIAAVLRAVKPGGHVIVATFGADGPTECSGLPVMRYSADALHREFGAPFTLVRHEREAHRTPGGAVQPFIYCYCRTSAS